jgi:hypothetical protein
MKCGIFLTSSNWGTGQRRNGYRVCNSCHVARVREYYWKHRIERAEYSKKYRDKTKLDAMIHYGTDPPSCKCCGTEEIEFLTLDHIDNDGAKHRRADMSRTRGRDFYSWLKRNSYPTSLRSQVLCWDCQWGKKSKKGCPHSGTRYPV